MKLFHLDRAEDPSGISGVGIVAEGVEFTDGTVVVRWFRNFHGIEPTTVVHPDIHNVFALHGHNGLTRIVWDT